MSSHAERGRIFGMQVCESLGLDPNNVTAIELRAAHDEVLTVTVTMHADAEQLKAARELITAHVSRVVLKGIDLSTGIESTEEWEFTA